jgi:hypothetical protein
MPQGVEAAFPLRHGRYRKVSTMTAPYPIHLTTPFGCFHLPDKDAYARHIASCRHPATDGAGICPRCVTVALPVIDEQYGWRSKN